LTFLVGFTLIFRFFLAEKPEKLSKEAVFFDSSRTEAQNESLILIPSG
jgi:hypothetical protein